MSLIKKKEEIELPKTIVGCITGVCGIGGGIDRRTNKNRSNERIHGNRY